MYYRPETKEVLALHSDIRASFAIHGPMVLFPEEMLDQELAARGVYPLVSNKPETDSAHTAVAGAITEVDGAWTQPWTVRAATAGELAARAPTRDQLKAQRQAIVDAITVTVGDKVFDGDEVSQSRMARALVAADAAGMTSCLWVLHDNTDVTVTKGELAQALALAMQAQAAVWVIK